MLTDSFLSRRIKLTFCILLAVQSFRVIAVTEDQFSVHGLSVFKHEQAEMLESWLTQGVNAT
jgi:hypothetical protein